MSPSHFSVPQVTFSKTPVMFFTLVDKRFSTIAKSRRQFFTSTEKNHVSYFLWRCPLCMSSLPWSMFQSSRQQGAIIRPPSHYAISCFLHGLVDFTYLSAVIKQQWLRNVCSDIGWRHANEWELSLYVALGKVKDSNYTVVVPKRLNACSCDHKK